VFGLSQSKISSFLVMWGGVFGAINAHGIQFVGPCEKLVVKYLMSKQCVSEIAIISLLSNASSKAEKIGYW